MTSFAGMHQGHFWAASPASIDTTKPPLTSVIPAPTLVAWASSNMKLEHIIWSPNLVWIAISVALYMAFPYDDRLFAVGSQGPVTEAFFRERLPLWMAVVLGYFAFWHVTIESWCRRSFVPNRPYRVAKVLHNVLYCASGVVIWVGFENVFVFLWATGRLAYMPDKDALATPANAALLALGMVLIPIWRDGHFYFAHRYIHFRPLFRYVHSLHHRNTDVEVFSGLCMHPVEHLYYYACILPCLLVPSLCSPLHFHFIGVHMLLAPAASHSGYEDHWQADAFHYYHHRYFEVNYAGLGCSFFDTWFGSFCGTLREKTPVAIRDDAKATIDVFSSPPTVEFSLYMIASAACVAAWISAVQPGGVMAQYLSGREAAALAGYGPVAIAVLATVLHEGAISVIRPYEKRPVWETLLHLAVGTYFGAYPVVEMLRLAS
jgi:sterol desaturase/sphingolipid hydroxylase (fatty acid hydroxylase superfamily)